MALSPPGVNYRKIAADKARQYGVPVDVFLRQIQQESGFDPNARSGAGAQGIAQFIPSTAKAYGLTNPYDPVASLDAAARYDKALLGQYGSIERALSAYNSGRPDAYKDPNFASGQTYRYVKQILGGVAPGAAAVPAAGTASSTVPPPAAATSSPDLFNIGNAMFGLPPMSAPLPPRQTLREFVNPKQSPAVQAIPGAGGATRIERRAAVLIQDYLGTPYVWGGSKPGGFDCSGLLQYTWAKVGVTIPRVTYDQWNTGTAVTRSQLRPGDAVFFHMGERGPEHVGMYLGGGKFIEAPHTGANVRVSTLAGRKDFLGGRRYA